MVPCWAGHRGLGVCWGGCDPAKPPHTHTALPSSLWGAGGCHGLQAHGFQGAALSQSRLFVLCHSFMALALPRHTVATLSLLPLPAPNSLKPEHNQQESHG